MKVLVTGASGFFGSHVAEELARQGCDVRVLVRRTSRRDFLSGFPHEVAIGDVADGGSLPAALAGVEAVVHAAGLIKARSAAEFDAVNARGTANLLAAIGQAAPDLRRFVYVSSLAAHGPSEDGGPRPPEAEPRPLTAYGRSKLAGEEAVRASPISGRAVIVRPSVIYGPRDPALLSFFQAVRWRVAPLLMGGHNRISIVYATDAARAVALATTAEAAVAGRAYFLDDGSVYSWRDLLSAVEAAVGRRALRISAPRWAFAAAAAASELFGLALRRAVVFNREKVLEMSQRYWVCSHEELKRDVGWQPEVGLEEGAGLTAEWYRANGWL